MLHVGGWGWGGGGGGLCHGGRPTRLNMKIFPSDSSKCCSSPYRYLVTSSRSCRGQPYKPDDRLRGAGRGRKVGPHEHKQSCVTQASHHDMW